VASNHCILDVTDRNGLHITQVEILVPYNGNDDCVRQAMQLRALHQELLYQQYPPVNHYVFANWLDMDTKARVGKGMIDE
jgi:hypothetical protein